MSRKNRLNLPLDLKDKFTELLGGKRPTTERLMKLLERKESPMPLDQDDIDRGRSRLSPREHAEAVASTSSVPISVDDAVAGAEAARAQRLAQGRTQLKDRMDANRERGLNPLAPPEDPIAAAMAEEVLAGLPPLPPAPVPLWETQPPALGLVDGAGTPIDNRDPFDDAAEIERLKSAGTAKLREVAETMERRILHRMPQIRGAGSKLRSLEEAAEALIAELQPASIDAIRQVCSEHNLEAWVVILGAVDRMAQLQELHAGEFDPEWLNRTPSGGRPASARDLKCEACGGVLPADARRGQKFCCSAHGSEKVSHSEGCSLSWLEMRQGRWVDTRGLAPR